MNNDYQPDKMRMMSAPLQGVTDSVWRTAQAAVFGGIDEYYTPFLRIERGGLRRRDARDVEPNRNQGINLVPQILGCSPTDALTMVHFLTQLGYHRIDVNLGCPFPPIAMHRKGAGLLPHPQLVEALFEALRSVPDVTYSVKMRLGWDSPDQWREVLPLFSILQPVQVTIHPRIGKQQYRGELDMTQCDAFVAACTYPVAYNGDLCTIADCQAIEQRYPQVVALMLGRGLAANPGMLATEPTAAQYCRFHAMLVDGYTAQLNGGEAQLVRRLQSIWEYFLPNTDRRLLKAIKKSRHLDAYLTAAQAALTSLDNQPSL